jgi:DNA-binding CsgD family transcriptional regulator
MFDSRELVASEVGLSRVISAIGDETFSIQFANYLNGTCGADHCAVFKWDPKQLVVVFSVSLDGTDTAYRQASVYMSNQYWRRDPSVVEVQHRLGEAVESGLYRLDVSCLNDVALRDAIYGRTQIKEKVLIFGGSPTSAILVSILHSKTSGPFTEEGLDRLQSVIPLLLTLLNKHTALTEQRAKPAMALTSFKDIEACIAGAPERFPRREAEVCSRILYGISSVGIALDLNISEETVMTYRKRAYHRLGIGSQRELLLWYMARWCGPRNEASRSLAACRT